MFTYFQSAYVELGQDSISVYLYGTHLTEAECMKDIEEAKLEFLEDLMLNFTEDEMRLLEKINKGTATLKDYNRAYVDSEYYVTIVENSDEEFTPEVVLGLARTVLSKMSPHERLEFLSQLGNLRPSHQE